VSATDQGSSQVEDYLTLEQQVCFALAVASRSVISLYRPLLEPLRLTHPQYLVMVALWEYEPLSVKELSKMLQLEPPTVSPVLKRLQAAGLVERHRDAADERSLRLTLTAEGRALRQQASQIPASIASRLNMSITQLEALHGQLVDVIARAQAAGGDTSPVLGAQLDD
jgi:DNA-binding MarR family transcriptional regulator